MAGKGGGAWKVAYADFVTAMMAFFLVMWIVGQDKPVKQLRWEGLRRHRPMVLRSADDQEPRLYRLTRELPQRAPK